ncbi:MAG: hypothetical protein U0935_22720 [Pirellulales bacterium]
MTRTTLSLCAFLASLLFLGSPSRPLSAQESGAGGPLTLEAVFGADGDSAEKGQESSEKSGEASTETEGKDERPEAKPQDEPTRQGIDQEAAEGRLAEGRSIDEGTVSTTPSSPGSLPGELEEPLSPELRELRERVRATLAAYYQEPISANNYSPWGIMHALIAYGVDTEIYVNDRKVNAIGWLCYNGVCRGQQLMYVENGKLRVRIGPGVQGHPGQFLAMLAQSRVRTDFPIKVDGQQFTVADLIESEKETCRARTELTFKLIALSHYLKTDATWKSDIGEEWSIPRLIKEELAQPVVGSACGGTHRMTGFSYAVNKRNKVGEEFVGQWMRAQKFVQSYHEYIFKLQNSDGSFSTNWFAGRGDSGEATRHVETTGHMLEWLVCSLAKDELDDPRVIAAVDHLTTLFENGRRQRQKWEIGPRGHALHALALYCERRFGDKPGSRAEMLARKPQASTTTR